MKDHDWEVLGQQWQQQLLTPTDDVLTVETPLRHHRQVHQRGLYGDGFALVLVAGLLAWALLTKPEHAVLLVGLALLLLLWQGGLWWLRRHWGLNHASTGLRQMLQADLRLARYRLLYHALGLPVGGLMLAWAWPQLPLPLEDAPASAWMVTVVVGSVGCGLWAGRQAWRRIAHMRAQLRQLDGGGG